jgi:hypothetical protein
VNPARGVGCAWPACPAIGTIISETTESVAIGFMTRAPRSAEFNFIPFDLNAATHHRDQIATPYAS